MSRAVFGGFDREYQEVVRMVVKLNVESSLLGRLTKNLTNLINQMGYMPAGLSVQISVWGGGLMPSF